MKKWKGIIAAVALACGTLTASAQHSGDLRFGVTAGMNVARVTDLDADSRIGFNLGLRLDYGITNNFYVSGALLFTQKGFKVEADRPVNLTYKGNPGYFEIPIHVGYRYHLDDDLNLFVETGPYFAFGICGKEKIEGSGRGDDWGSGWFNRYDSNDLENDYFGGGAARVFDGGWGLRFGVEVSSFQIHMAYDYGFSKVWEGSSCHNSNFSVGLTYMF